MAESAAITKEKAEGKFFHEKERDTEWLVARKKNCGCGYAGGRIHTRRSL